MIHPFARVTEINRDLLGWLNARKVDKKNELAAELPPEHVEAGSNIATTTKQELIARPVGDSKHSRSRCVSDQSQ
jgi:hypothetical protein